MNSERRVRVFVVAIVLIAACHRGVEEAPLGSDLVTMRDRFFDVSTRDGEHVIVVGYGGKILRSDDGGTTWSRAKSDTGKALMRVGFADGDRGWAVGQDGTVLRTDDGGRTWGIQDSGTRNHLFGLTVISHDRVFACGDRSQWISTSDGGTTWSGGQVPLSDVGMNPEIALAVREPIYYDVTFRGQSVGWMVGDYGNIRFTRDGGRTWESQHGSLLGQKMPRYRRALRDALDLPALFRVRMQDEQHGFAVGVAGVVLETRDGGGRWTIVDLQLSPPIEAPLLEVAFPAGVPFLLGGSGAAVALEGGAWKRRSLGLPILTWFVGAAFATEGDHAGRRGFAVGGRGLVLRTDDAGVSWRPMTQTLGGGA